MNVITSRLPSHLAGRRLSGRFARIGVLNLILAAAFIGAGVAAYLTVGTSSSTSNAAVRTATVQRGVVLSTLSATGTLQAATQLSLDFTSSGQIVSVTVKAGQHVKKGQVLGRIDSTSAHQALLQAEASLRSANANLQTTLTGETPPERAQDAITVAQARQSVANAKISFAATKRSIALDKVTTAASLSQAQKQLRADQGQLQVDLAKQKADSATYANVDAATAAVTADKSKVANDQAKQQTDQQSQLVWQQQLSSDQASLKTALKRIPELRAEFWQNVNVTGDNEQLNPALEHAGRVADFLEFGELLCLDALTRNESCGSHFRVEYQEEGECKRDDTNFAHVAAWEYQGEGRPPVLHKEPLTYEEIHMSTRSYK